MSRDDNPPVDQNKPVVHSDRPDISDAGFGGLSAEQKRALEEQARSGQPRPVRTVTMTDPNAKDQTKGVIVEEGDTRQEQAQKSPDEQKKQLQEQQKSGQNPAAPTQGVSSADQP